MNPKFNPRLSTAYRRKYKEIDVMQILSEAHVLNNKKNLHDWFFGLIGNGIKSSTETIVKQTDKGFYLTEELKYSKYCT